MTPGEIVTDGVHQSDTGTVGPGYIIPCFNQIEKCKAQLIRILDLAAVRVGIAGCIRGGVLISLALATCGDKIADLLVLVVTDGFILLDERVISINRCV
jgi:hypothetical protein